MTRVKVRFRGLAKHTAHVVTLFALSNLWMARGQLMGQVRPKIVGADPNLSHRADRILSQGWGPAFRGPAVDKCRSVLAL